MTEYLPVHEGKSLYKFFHYYWLSDPEVNDRAIRRLCSLVRKLKVKTAIVEALSAEDEIVKKEKQAIDVYFDLDLESQNFRITFSDMLLTSDESLADPEVKNSFLGNVVVINLFIPEATVVPKVGSVNKYGWHSYIYFASLTVPFTRREGKKRYYLLNNYLHSARDITDQFMTSSGTPYEYSYFGSYFFQKSTYTSVCSQAALCMTLNNANLVGDEKFIVPEDINKMVGIDHVTKKFAAKLPSDRAEITSDEIKKILTHLGLNVSMLDFFNYPNTDYVEYLYSYVESNCTTMLVFVVETDLHVVPILGHTLNTDMWRPEAELNYDPNLSKSKRFRSTSSSSWVDHFIIHDDNLGMYYSLPVDSLRRVTLPMKDPFFRAKCGIAITRKKLGMTAKDCECVSSVAARNLILGMKNDYDVALSYWLRKIFLSLKNESVTPFVTRTLLAQKDTYSKHLKEKSDFDGVKFSGEDLNKILSDLPGEFWLTEITLPDLYTTNKSKIADIFFRCEPEYDPNEPFKNMLQARLSEWLLSFKNGIKELPDISYLTPTGHFPLFCYKESCEPEEW